MTTQNPTQPLTADQLDDIEARAAHLHEYGTLTDEPLQEDLDRLTGIEVPALLAEVRRLQAALSREKRLHGDTIDDRDHAHDAADKLAYAVASEEVIGEHTADNSPWANAYELITSMADVAALREELDRQTALAEQGARANRELTRLRTAGEQPAAEDTLPAWLYSRFNDALDAPAWDRLTDDDRTYWEHQARAVRRAVARGGFKAAEGAQR
ncbi:hypothetical protein [Streptomyces sp. NPDC088736]|uniref:hypothetical protein n=1 Tax=Streptomyces sp. NPDC088736 TaxID=3365881 RepID=UPI00381FB9D6